MPRRRIVVVTGEVIAARMAGPAIRAREIARALAVDHDVVLVSTARCELSDPAFSCRHADGDALAELGATADVLVVQGDALRRAPAMLSTSAAVVVDLYAPFQLEVLEGTRGVEPISRRRAVGHSLDVVNQQLRRGDFFLAASPRQRDFWVGHLTAVGRVNELVYDESPDLERLIAVVPFGIPDAPAVRSGPGIRGVVPGIGPDDDILFWGGGIYEWFDPLTLVHAVDRLHVRRPNLRLFFAGTRHPNPAVGETPMARRAQALSDDLGLTGTHVFFHDWVAYDDRVNYLLDADLAVSTHYEHVETAYSFRTRILDALWAGLPVIATSGDAFADAIVEAGAGLEVAPEDVESLATAIDRLLGDGSARASASEAAAALGERFRWSRALAPVVEFCASPDRRPDLGAAATAASIARGGDLVGAASPVGTAISHVRRREWDILRVKVERRFRRGA
jgi:glycosyltransferase involved in cell wall biosynthesis